MKALVITTAIAAIVYQPIVNLGIYGLRYHEMADIAVPFLQQGWIPVNFFASKPVYRDAGDVQWMFWLESITSLGACLLFFSATSMLMDKLICGLPLTVHWACRLRTVFNLCSSFLFLWKVIGAYMIVLPLHATASFVVTLCFRDLVKCFGGGDKWKVFTLGLVWVLNFYIFFNVETIHGMIQPTLQRVNRTANSKLALHWFLAYFKGGTFKWDTLVRMSLFRVIDYATYSLLHQNKTMDSIYAELIKYIEYCLYAPLVWQGPIIGYQSFLTQEQRRYKRRGKHYVRRSARIQGKAIKKLTLELAGNFLLLEVINHNWFAWMLYNRGQYKLMRSDQVLMIVVFRAATHILRMMTTWRYFRLWAYLDGVNVPRNFPKPLIACVSVSDMWRSFNASVHLWILNNIYHPLCLTLKLHKYIGVVGGFFFMAASHKFGPCWLWFVGLNSIFVLVEQLTGSETGGTSLMSSFVWAFKVVTLNFVHLSFYSAEAEKQQYLTQPRDLYYRIFVNDDVEPALAKQYHISHNVHKLFGVMSRPMQVSVGVGIVLVCIHQLFARKTSIGEYDKSAPYKEQEKPHRIEREIQNCSHERLREMAYFEATTRVAQFPTICDLLEWRGNNTEGRNNVAFVWLGKDGAVVDQLTFAQLLYEAKSLAKQLRSHQGLNPGDRAVLVYTPGLKFVVALFACFFAKVIAVPAYPPDPSKDLAKDAVFENIVRDSGSRAILCDSAYTIVRAHWFIHRLLKRFLFEAMRMGLFFAPLAALIFVHYVKVTTKFYHSVGMLLPDAEFRSSREKGELLLFDLSLVLLVSSWSIYTAISKNMFFVTVAQPSNDHNQIWCQTNSIFEVLCPRVYFWFRSMLPMNPNLNLESLGADQNGVAYIQYTSGSTANPKGVCISHANIMHQGLVNQVSYGCIGAGQTAVNWCPQYHDLGLVVCTLSSIFAGIRLVSFSPIHFIRNPMLWVRTISKYRARFSAAPDFAYAYTARRFRTDLASGEVDLPEDFDLSCWKVAGNGGEPVHVESLEAFAQAFETFGFQVNAFFPCFGLAEHTIMATGRRSYSSPTVLELDAFRLESHRVEISRDGGGQTTLCVGCGEPCSGVDIQIVDPVTCQPVPDAATHVGEIWLSSQSVALGYWGKTPEQNAKVFSAALCVDSGYLNNTYLRTGDLGFVYRNELFVCGRIKDLIIMDGRNIYPHDIEVSAEVGVSGFFRRGSSVACLIDEALVLFVELSPKFRTCSTPELESACRRVFHEVSNEQRLLLHSLHVLPARTLTKTSSGKVKRSDAKKRFIRGELKPLFSMDVGLASNSTVIEPQQDEIGWDDEVCEDPLYISIVESILVTCGCPEKWDPDESSVTHLLHLCISDLMVDNTSSKKQQRRAFSSLDAVQFTCQLSKELEKRRADCSLSPDTALHYTTVGTMANHVYKQANRAFF